MKNRIIGFDLARSYAILGMYIVNFNTVFGSVKNKEGLSGFLNLFNGNSSSLFVILAGMGVALMSNREQYNIEEKKQLIKKLSRRSWFLFFLGVAFCFWWPADILHFYGTYMHLGILLLFLPKRYYLIAAGAAILIFHGLLAFIPFETGWDFNTFQYAHFWTPLGFLRNTFYNGWNAVFPWVAYFFFGMYLGRLNWQDGKTAKQIFLIGLLVYSLVSLLQSKAPSLTQDPAIIAYLQADYLPPFLPFMLSTASFSLMLIGIFMFVGSAIGNSWLAKAFASTGQMTLTHYIAHLSIGLFLLAWLSGKPLDYDILSLQASDPALILGFSIFYFLLSCVFSYLWKMKFNQGPLEMLLRGRESV